MISENLASIKHQIAEAAGRAGRDPDSVRLVAVSKEIPAQKILEAKAAGMTVFGENKIQEARDKIDQIGQPDISWHFIGHLQKNKVKYLFGRFDLIHSVDSAALAEVLNQESLKRGCVTDVLVQVNISGEPTKFGVAPQNLPAMLESMAHCSALRIQGLMTVPPFDPDPGKSRGYFADLRKLRDGIDVSGLDNVTLNELSMGMSNDFTVAIEEGATLVRIGSAIFGPRPTRTHSQ